MPIDNPDRRSLGWVVSHSASNEQLEQLKAKELTAALVNRLAKAVNMSYSKLSTMPQKPGQASIKSLLSMVR